MVWGCGFCSPISKFHRAHDKMIGNPKTEHRCHMGDDIGLQVIRGFG